MGVFPDGDSEPVPVVPETKAPVVPLGESPKIQGQGVPTGTPIQAVSPGSSGTPEPAVPRVTVGTSGQTVPTGNPGPGVPQVNSQGVGPKQGFPPGTPDMERIKRVLIQASKPAVAAYLTQAKEWVVSGGQVSIYFDNKVAYGIVLPDAEALDSLVKGLGLSGLVLLEKEEKQEEVNLDDFDRQVDLIAQVFRGEKVSDTMGEKK